MTAVGIQITPFGGRVMVESVDDITPWLHKNYPGQSGVGYDVQAIKDHIAEKYPEFKVLNRESERSLYAVETGAPTEDRVNPKRICFYWANYESSDAEASVKDVRNRYRHGLPEVGDQDCRPIYIEIPDDQDYATLQALMNDIRTLYPDAFAGDDKRFTSINLSSHGNLGGIIADADGWGGFDVFPGIGNWMPGYEDAPFYEETEYLDVEACSQLWNMSEKGVGLLQKLSQEHDVALELTSTITSSNWLVHPPTKQPIRTPLDEVYTCEKSSLEPNSFTILDEDSGQVSAYGSMDPGGLNFLFYPDGHVFPEGTVADKAGIALITLFDDSQNAALKANGCCDADAHLQPIIQAWGKGGQNILEAQYASPNEIVSYTDEEAKNIIEFLQEMEMTKHSSE